MCMTHHQDTHGCPFTDRASARRKGGGAPLSPTVARLDVVRQTLGFTLPAPSTGFSLCQGQYSPSARAPCPLLAIVTGNEVDGTARKGALLFSAPKGNQDYDLTLTYQRAPNLGDWQAKTQSYQ